MDWIEVGQEDTEHPADRAIHPFKWLFKGGGVVVTRDFFFR